MCYGFSCVGGQEGSSSSGAEEEDEWDQELFVGYRYRDLYWRRIHWDGVSWGLDT
jgi:hypothetical protein